MKIAVEDLRKGDVVLIAKNSTLIDVKLLRTPRLSPTGKTTCNGIKKWVSVPCLMREEILTHTYTRGNGTQASYQYKRAKMSDGSNYNKEVRIDFTNREVWLINRENI